MKDIKFIAFRHYGANKSPVIAVLWIDSFPMFYDFNGICSLIKDSSEGETLELLNEIKLKMLIPGEYKDIQESDFSGQKSLL